MTRTKSRKNLDPLAKVSRAKYQCPEKLAALIKKINYVPLKIEMSSSVSARTDTWLNDNEAGRQIILFRLKNLIADLPEDFRAYFNELMTNRVNELRRQLSNESMTGIEDFPKDEGNAGFSQLTPGETRNYSDSELEVLCLKDFLTLYDEFYSLREDVLNFVEVRNYERQIELAQARSQAQIKKKAVELKAGNPDLEIKRAPSAGPTVNSEILTRKLVTTAPILRDENGQDYVGGFAALLGTFDSNRLRICEICTQLFWAKRKESETCSPRCFNNLRQRLYRHLSDEEKEARKLQRLAAKHSQDE